MVVLYGDVPLVQSKTLNKLLKLASNKSLAAITFKAENPRGYGRIIRSSRNQVEAIIEEKDATKSQKSINEVNSGILAIKSTLIKKLLPEIKNKLVNPVFFIFFTNNFNDLIFFGGKP